jgi:hypothetical protein
MAIRTAGQHVPETSLSNWQINAPAPADASVYGSKLPLLLTSGPHATSCKVSNTLSLSALMMYATPPFNLTYGGPGTGLPQTTLACGPPSSTPGL